MPERMYSDLAEWWHLLSAPEDYAEEAAFYASLFEKHARGDVRSVLELGSGGGNNASHLKARYEMILVDLSERMQAMSRSLNPECDHATGDMRDVRLGRLFDAVFVHDAVSYITSQLDLRRVIETAFIHLRAGGVAVFCPDYVRETFRPRTGHGGHDGTDGRAMRYLEWAYDPDPDDSTYTVDYAFILRGPDGEARVEHDRHVEGLFATEAWLRLLAEGGFQPHTARLELAEEDIGGVVFVGVKA